MALGIITKPIWCNYFAVFGISHDMAYQLMPVLGSFDILLGIVLLVYPVRAIPAWLVFWGIVTALLRPLSGEPFAEFIERAGNFGAPLALLLSGKARSWFARIRPDGPVDPAVLKRVICCLRIVVFLLLLGHGWLNIIEKKGLIGQYTSLGIPNPGNAALTIGLLEVVAACAVLIRPVGGLVITLFLWKMASELFYPHYEVFEWIERGGSYGCLLALWLALPRTHAYGPSKEGIGMAT